MSSRLGIVIWRIYTSPSRVSLARARSLFRLLLPSACYAGYTWGNVDQRTAGKFNRAVRHVSLTSWRPKIDVLRRRMIKRRPIPDPGSSATILYFSLRHKLSPWEPLGATGAGWGCKEGHTTELCTWRLRPEAQPLNLLCNSFDRKSTPFLLYWYPFHAPSKNTASLLTTVNAPSFHINKTPNQEGFLSFSQPKMYLLAGF